MSALAALTLLTTALVIAVAVCAAIIFMQHEQIKDLNQYIRDLIQGLNK